MSEIGKLLQADPDGSGLRIRRLELQWEMYKKIDIFFEQRDRRDSPGRQFRLSNNSSCPEDIKEQEMDVTAAPYQSGYE
jgi:hypothetical protein